MRVRISRSTEGTFISIFYEGEILSTERRTDDITETDVINIQMCDGKEIQIITSKGDSSALILSNDLMIIQGQITVAENTIRISVDSFQVYFELNNTERDILIPMLGDAYGEEEDSISRGEGRYPPIRE
ncbi:MAG: hypothetical protein QXH51_06105 [Candidatus Bathyarchaeia archaeon]